MYREDGTIISFKDIVQEQIGFKKLSSTQNERFFSHIREKHPDFPMEEMEKMQALERKRKKQIRLLEALEAAL